MHIGLLVLFYFWPHHMHFRFQFFIQISLHAYKDGEELKRGKGEGNKLFLKREEGKKNRGGPRGMSGEKEAGEGKGPGDFAARS